MYNHFKKNLLCTVSHHLTDEAYDTSKEELKPEMYDSIHNLILKI